MDWLRLIETFVRVATAESFSVAAEQLGLSRAAITKQIQDLEAQLGARLLNRTTRRVWPTEVGAIYLDRCRQILMDLEEANEAVRQHREEIGGRLTVLVPRSFASTLLATALAEFALKHPAIDLNLVLGDSSSHGFGTTDGTFDVAIRLWTIPEDAATIAKKVGYLGWVLCGSPAYLEKIAPLNSPADLTRCNCLVHPRLAPDHVWRFADGSKVKVSGNFAANSILAIRRAAIYGVGIAQLPRYYVESDLRRGILKELLPDSPSPERPVYLVLPARRFVPTRVRIFIDYFTEWFRATARLESLHD